MNLQLLRWLTTKVKNQFAAVGDRRAKTMLGRTPKYKRNKTFLEQGCDHDFIVTEEMIKHFIKKVHKRSTFYESQGIDLCFNWINTCRTKSNSR